MLNSATITVRFVYLIVYYLDFVGSHALRTVVPFFRPRFQMDDWLKSTVYMIDKNLGRAFSIDMYFR